jgi:hypothetical protein
VTFAAGLVAGIVITALGGVFVFQARVIEGSGRSRMPDLRNLIAVAALIIAIVALARSGDRGSTPARDVTGPTATSVVPPTASSSLPGSPSSTTSTTELHPVTVPKVIGLTQTDAIAALDRAGLRARVQPFAVGNVPAGFVVTETPMAFSTATSGSIVLLGVSTGA